MEFDRLVSARAVSSLLDREGVSEGKVCADTAIDEGVIFVVTVLVEELNQKFSAEFEFLHVEA